MHSTSIPLPQTYDGPTDLRRVGLNRDAMSALGRKQPQGTSASYEPPAIRLLGRSLTAHES